MYKVSGIILIAISIIISIGGVMDYKTMKTGKIVKVEVLEVLTSCNERNRTKSPSFRFIFKNKTHTKNIKGKYCNIIKAGAVIELKTNSDNTIFLYPNENILLDNLANVGLFLVGFLFLFKKEKNE